MWDEKEQRYFIYVLIECKSRLFDIREAEKQVSLEFEEDHTKLSFAEMKNLKKKNQLEAQKRNEQKKKLK